MLPSRRLAPLLALALASLAVGCAPAEDVDEETSEDAVKVDTSTPTARAQYDANVKFAQAYAAQCKSTGSGKRVLVTGFGRFMGITNNATGRIVSSLVPGARYPETVQPARGQVDQPDAQLSVGSSTVELPNAGKVTVCGMVLPVYWDLAAILIAKEMDEFKPDLVVMMGVAGGRQPIWIELGAVNKAAPLDDGSDQLRPAVGTNEQHAPIIDRIAQADQARGNLMSWARVQAAAEKRAQELASKVDGGTRFGDVLSGARLAGYPRSSNTYLCNNVTFVTGYLMDHPSRRVTLLRASTKVAGVANQVDVRMKTDLRATPRTFIHWPSSLTTEQYPHAAEVLKAVLDAQLTAPASDAPARGDNELADPSLRGGGFF